MKLQFKIQPYQTDAVDAVVNCFAGQPLFDGVSYRIDPGRRPEPTGEEPQTLDVPDGRLKRATPTAGLRNAEIVLSPAQLLANVHTVQRQQSLPLSKGLVSSKAASSSAPNLDVEMETGTGKTYVYIKTIMELNKRYGWSKFIVVVPSVAIREGVKKSFEVTAEHFQQTYRTKPRAFVYDSKRLHELERFSSDAGVQVMIINIQAFNSSGKDNRRIYDELDEFQSRKPIDVISANRPIVIIDEPQKIGAATSLQSLSNFNAMAVLRYSATHKLEHNKVHRLDAVDAYNHKLVKKIGVRGITVKGLAGSTAYLYLDAIEVRRSAGPQARVEIEVQTKGGPITRQVRRIEKGTNLHDLSGGIEAYKPDGRALIVTDVDALRDVIELSNGDLVAVGQVTEDVAEGAKRRIQIREVIRSHLDKERALYARGVKVLSLFFIDEVVKYRDYSHEDRHGEYARMFVEEYQAIVSEELSQLDLDDQGRAYREYLASIPVKETHAGYFSIDKKSKRMVDPAVSGRGDDKGQATDVDAYDLILRDKERLLSFSEPVRFLFSHSALREGWDNPNVFVLGMLKKSDNTVSRRQEIGRGLRISVDQHGERMDHPVLVHEINELTVVTDESYTAFVQGLQKEISESLANRPREASEKYFEGMALRAGGGTVAVSQAQARALYKYLIVNDYLNEDNTLSETYRAAREAGTLAEPTSELLIPHIELFWGLIDTLDVDFPLPGDARKPKAIPLNQENFARREFQELWNRINHKAVYQVEFDSEELIGKCVTELDAHLNVTVMQYYVETGELGTDVTAEQLKAGAGFTDGSHRTERSEVSAASQVKYDLLGEITEKTQLTRRTAAAILQRIRPMTFAKYRQNPEQFITECARLINEQKATVIIEHLSYDTLDDRFDSTIFTQNQSKQDFAKAGEKLKKHVYDYVVTDSATERSFVEKLDSADEVVVYAKLPRGFFIPTPVGSYNPDWAIAFDEGKVRHVYFVAETKGSMSSLQLRGVEEAKIECARKFFAQINEAHESVAYDVVDSYAKLLELVGVGE